MHKRKIDFDNNILKGHFIKLGQYSANIDD